MDWVVDLEIAMVERFGWSLYDIDNTDIESLMPFIYRLAERDAPDEQREIDTSPKPRSVVGRRGTVFIDQAPGW